jgi:biotin synthase
MRKSIDQLERDHTISREAYVELIEYVDKQNITIKNVFNDDVTGYLFERANAAREKVYGREIYIRGLIEFSSFCKNDCLYCGIRRSNHNAERYRLSKEQILECCEIGYELGFRTFVLQSGEDLVYNDEVMTDIVKEIRSRFPNCAITLSLGERSDESYKALYDGDANRYLLRHETANEGHYKKLQPPQMSLSARKNCLYQLKEIGSVVFLSSSSFI